MSNRIGFFSFGFFVILALSGLIAGGNSESGAAGKASDAAIVITHKYGETVFSSVPERVVSLGLGEHETLLALGVIPIAVREPSHGTDMPYATGPWVPEELRDKLIKANPAVLPGNELDFEVIVGLAPDVIVGITSSITKEEYDMLVQIAPTIVRPAEYGKYGTPWQVTTRMLGQVLGKTAEAEKVISGIENRIDGIKARHPEFDGASAAVGFVYSNQAGAFTSQTPICMLLQQLGFVIPPEYDEIGGDKFHFSFSEERFDLLDTDVILWSGSRAGALQGIKDFPLRDTMTASAEGRELFMGQMNGRALLYSSPPSINFMLDILEPGLAAAVDGDPATLVPESFRID